MTAVETPLFFDSGASRLFGVFHEPAEGVAPRTPFVFCHPFGEEKLWTHRVFVSFARQLAQAGHPVLRFDFLGAGDSAGQLRDASVTSWLADLACALTLVRARTGASEIHLLGLRLGGTLAALAAETLPGIGRLILWAPVVDGARYMQELLRINLTTQMATYKEVRQDRQAMQAEMERGGTVNVDGYELAQPLFGSVSAVSLAAEAKRHAGPCLVVQIDRAGARPARDLEQLSASYAQATLALVEEEPFWKEIARFYDTAPQLFSHTAAWLADGPGTTP